jgi:hypothetical protein
MQKIEGVEGVLKEGKIEEEPMRCASDEDLEEHTSSS